MTYRATIEEALAEEWQIVLAGDKVGKNKAKNNSIYTVSGKEVLASTEWLRVDMKVLEHIVFLHNHTRL